MVVMVVVVVMIVMVFMVEAFENRGLTQDDPLKWPLVGGSWDGTNLTHTRRTILFLLQNENN